MRFTFSTLSKAAATLALGAAFTTAALPARAEGTLRIAQQFGVVYLLLNVAQDQKLIEKHGQKAGVPIRVDWIQLSGGNAVNDALLSGSIASWVPGGSSLDSSASWPRGCCCRHISRGRAVHSTRTRSY